MREVGTRVGAYVLRSLLGRGGFGEVWMAEDPEGVRVAVKILDPVPGNREQAQARFAKEYDALRRIDSRNVAQIRDADLDGPLPWMAFLLAGTRTLRHVLDEEPPPRPRPWSPPSEEVKTTGCAEIMAALRGAARGLVALHAAGMTHCDISPDNILMVPGDGVVLDLGLATFGYGSELSLAVVGKPHYMAPEQLAGMAPRPASDVWQWAVTACKVLGGRLPFPPVDDYAVQRELVMTAKPKLPMVLHGDAPGELRRAVLWRCLEKNPSMRPTAAELVELLVPQLDDGDRWFSHDFVTTVERVEFRTLADGDIASRTFTADDFEIRIDRSPFGPDLATRIGDAVWVNGSRDSSPPFADVLTSLRTGLERPVRLDGCPACGMPLGGSTLRPRCVNARYCRPQVKNLLRRMFGQRWKLLDQSGAVDWLFDNGHLTDGREALTVDPNVFDDRRHAGLYRVARDEVLERTYRELLRELLGIKSTDERGLDAMAERYPGLRELAGVEVNELVENGLSRMTASRVWRVLKRTGLTEVIGYWERAGMCVCITANPQ